MRRAIIMVWVAAMVAVFAGPAWSGEEPSCWDCQTRASKWRDGKEAGDIIACQPVGATWGTKDSDPKKYTFVRICDTTKAEMRALTSHKRDAKGEPLNEFRFSAIVVEDRPVLADKTTSLAVTPADAKATVELESKSLPAPDWEVPK